MSRRSAWQAGSFVIGLFAVVLTLVEGISWFADWVPWLITLLTAGLIVFLMRGNYCAAGADWLKTHNGWVKTYELDEITMHLNSSSVDLALKDSSGRRTSNKVPDLQAISGTWSTTGFGTPSRAAPTPTATREEP